MHTMAQVVASFLLAGWPIWVGFSAMLLGGPGAADKPLNLLVVFAFFAYPVLIGWYFVAHAYSLWGIPPKVFFAITWLAPLIGLTQLWPMVANIARGIRSEGYSVLEDAVYLDGKAVAGADPRTFQDAAPGHRYPYYGKDQRHVFIGSAVLDGADPETFELLSPFARDKNRVWLKAKPMPQIEPASLAPLQQDGKQSGYWRDRERVYTDEGVVLEGADPDTFKVIDGGYVRDQHYVYWRTERVQGADPETFRFLMSDYGTDAQRVYRRKTPVLPEADLATLQPVVSWFARDARHVFLMSDEPHVIEGLDPASFEELQFGYVKDKAAVYRMHDERLTKLEGADPASFTVGEQMSGGVRVADARDRRRSYREGEPVTP